MHNSSKNNLLELNSKIINCSVCSRLVNFRDEIAKTKRKMYKKTRKPVGCPCLGRVLCASKVGKPSQG